MSSAASVPASDREPGLLADDREPGSPAADSRAILPAPGHQPPGAPDSLLGRLALARGEVDRSAELRTDAEWLAAAWASPQTRVLTVQRGQAMVSFGADGASLVFGSPATAPAGVRFLLGVDADGVAYFGVSPEPTGVASSRASQLPADRPDDHPRLSSLREAGPLLSDRDAGLLTHAVALANWHETFTHCPRCGSPTDVVSSGHARRCPVDDSEHFPRVDPAMIVLVTDSADRCLLARNAQWPEHRVSILAGFVEAGESVEQAVAREVHEESGICVSEVRYLGSQPWPMPQSLMLGFRALAPGTQEIVVDSAEIAEAFWFSRPGLRAAIDSGEIRLPPPVSIAHRIIESWYGSTLPGSW